MGSLSIWHWLVLGLVVLVLFGRGKISDVMGDVAKGIKSFKSGLAEDDEPVPPRAVDRPVAEPVATPVSRPETVER